MVDFPEHTYSTLEAGNFLIGSVTIKLS